MTADLLPPHKWATLVTMARRLGALAAVGLVCAFALASCGVHGSIAIPARRIPIQHNPVTLPAARVLVISPSLCGATFGSPASIAREFGSKSLKLTVSESEPNVPFSFFQCAYKGPGGREGPLLALTTHAVNDDCNGCGSVYDIKAGLIYADYSPPGGPASDSESAPRNIQAWLRKTAARAIPAQVAPTRAPPRPASKDPAPPG